MHKLDSIYGVNVDYWANSMSMWFICDNLHRRKSNSSNGKSSSDRSNNSNVKLMISQDDLVDFNGTPTLVLRFKNCTGNFIILDNSAHKITQKEKDESYIALTVDHQFKN